MNLGQIISEIEDAVQDETYLSGTIQTMINEAVLTIATGLPTPGRYEETTPPLPSLYTTDTVDTTLSSGIADLPTTFNRDVIQVLNSDSKEIPIIKSFQKFLKNNPEQNAGDVIKCAVSGGRIFYREIPAAAETLTLHFYEAPATLALNTDIPSCIPIHLHRPLIVGYVCREIFNKIELGMAGPKVDTANYSRIFDKGLLDLADYYPHDGVSEYYEDLTDYCE